MSYFVSWHSSMHENWLRTDESEDAIISMTVVAETAPRVLDDIAYWKWTIISLHSAFQSAMVMYLSLGDDLLVMRQEDAESWLAAHDKGEPYPETMMDGFLNLYRKLKATERAGYSFRPNGTQGSSIKKLNSFRNEFVHFMPKGWSIEMTGMPSICKDCLDVIAELDHNFLCMRWESEEQMGRFRQQLRSAKATMDKLATVYGS